MNLNWTIAYRKRTANRFQRVNNWSGTWDEAQNMGSRMAALYPHLQVWTTTTREYEAARALEVADGVADGTLSQEYALEVLEDHGNIMVDSGKRIRITDDGVLPDDLPIPGTLEGVTVEQFTAAVDEVITEFGEGFVYNLSPSTADCLYQPVDNADLFDDSDPRALTGCLVGSAALKLGIFIPPDAPGVGCLILNDGDGSVSVGRLLAFAAALQRSQDSGDSWGTARNEAFTALGEWMLRD